MSHASPDQPFQPLAIAVMTVSDSRTEADDKSGRLLADRLQAEGHRLAEKVIVPDDPPARTAGTASSATSSICVTSPATWWK